MALSRPMAEVHQLHKPGLSPLFFPSMHPEKTTRSAPPWR